ncbi:MAG: transglycosylase SLT domain-containing protein [bacterium]|nr:transglycosylase SLT domain-containing protein [bacterium]
MKAYQEDGNVSPSDLALRRIWIGGTLLALSLFVANYFVFNNLIQRPRSVRSHTPHSLVDLAPIISPKTDPQFGQSLSEIKKREHVRTLVFQNFKGSPLKERVALFEVIYHQSRAKNIDPYLTLSIIATESSFRKKAVSWAGAYGLMQIKKLTAAEVAGELGIPWEGEATLFDPATNIKLGIQYLAKMRARFGNMSDALTAYNYGPHYVASCLRNEKRLPDKYVKKINRNLTRYGLKAAQLVSTEGTA